MPRLLLVAGAAVILVAMTGCVDPKPPITPSPTATAAPVFASEEEALAAAEEAYAAYLAVSDAVSGDGGKHPERLEGYMTAEELDRAVERFSDLAASGRHTQGSTVFRSSTLQHWDDMEVAMYLCLDVSGVRVLDAQGTDVTPIDRPDHIPLEVTFRVEAPTALLLESSDVWEGAEICGS